MMKKIISPLCLLPLTLLFEIGCGTDGTNSTDDMNPNSVPPDPVEQTMTPPGACLPDVTCTGTPPGLTTKAWRHGLASPTTLLAGAANHRGIDLIATVDAPEQSLRGEISYGIIDKALEDEDVELWACRAGAWSLLGIVTTDNEGHFEYKMSGPDRLPVGRRQIFVSVRGDRSSVGMLAVVLPSGGKAAVSDVDGTLTTYENEYPESLVTGNPVKAHDGAPEAFQALAANCYQPIYVTARGTVFTESTRKWLSDRGFPLGPLRLAPGILTIPGDATIAYKTDTMTAISASMVSIFLGNGNRASDAQAYKTVGLAGDHISLKRPEYSSEIDPVIARGDAIGIDSYRDIIPRWSSYPRAP